MTADASALAGLRVTCLAVYIPALVAVQRLREWGAAVTVVEPPAGDPLETIAPTWYRALHEGCTTQRLDVRAPNESAAFGELLRSSDVLITALRPSSLERLGLGWDALHARYPQLCHVAITGFASPAAEDPGHDLTYQALVGLVQPPELPRSLLADLAGAERTALTAAALLLGRERGGEARRAEVSLAMAADSFAEPLRQGLTAPGGILGGALPGYSLYRVRDGWVAVAALEPHFWRRLCSELTGEGAELDRETLQSILAVESAEHWERWARERALPITAVRSP
ncbi:MAG TPA: CoA transferase [Gemmatimonadaceae bacterium]|nr:CoA transferase [Gemmatimonadaceae bacterium]